VNKGGQERFRKPSAAIPTPMLSTTIVPSSNMEESRQILNRIERLHYASTGDADCLASTQVAKIRLEPRGTL
jgi:hypothetical protein